MLSALKTNVPVVALESTIITHGMPYPHNLNTALAVEEIIRNEVFTYIFIVMHLLLFYTTFF